MKKSTRNRRIFRLLHTRAFQAIIGLVIAVDLVSTIGSSFLEFRSWDGISFATTLLAALIFTVEYGCRIATAPCLFPHLTAWRARLKYLFSFFGIIDFIAILPFAGIFVFSGHYKELFEISQVFLTFKLIRYSQSFHYISKVFKSVKEDLTTVFGTMGIFIVFSALLMYHIERGAQPEAFSNVGQGMWWAVITFTSVGYGDIYPITPWGKILGGLIAVLGIMIVAIPTGIVSSAFVNYKLKKGDGSDGEKEKR